MAKLISKSSRRPQRVFTIVMWVLSVVFAGFLIGLGSLVIRDIPSVDRTVTLETFVDAGEMSALTNRQTEVMAGLRGLERAVQDASEAVVSARSDYEARQRAFEAWIATRSATQAEATNPEVISRTRELERLSGAVRDAQRRLEAAEQALVTADRIRMDVNQEMSALRLAAEPDYRRALRAQELRVFGFRLMLTLPLLLVAGWMVARKRESAYWPLYRGFVLFAGFAFFVELVPYLPSYGGYVRYAVGIVVVTVAGYFLIRQMRTYLERKQEEEARSEVERRQSIDYETALKKIAAKTCPGCDRAIVTRDGVHSDYCVHCGIHLQRECPVCGTRNVTFHRFCLSCGAPNTDTPQVQEPPPAMA